MSLNRRLEKLEGRADAGPRANWDNLHAVRPEDVVPDGVVDWAALFVPRPDPLPDPLADALARLNLTPHDRPL